MSLNKLDQRLIEEIKIRRESGLAEGKSLDKIAKEAYHVTIELTEQVYTKMGVSRQQIFREIEHQVERAQSGVIDNLRKLGITEFERQTLSNSITATLKLDQIEEIAKRSEVKIIRLVRYDKVTLSS